MVMARSVKTGMSVLLLPLVLSACAGGGTHATPSTTWRPDSSQLLVRSERADRVRVEGIGDVAISSTYMAASGNECRKLETLDGEALSLRSCKNRSGEWYTTRDISVSDPFTHSMQATSTVVESVSLTLKPGESLWRFANRVTGSPLNWKKIATFNNIEDADSVKADQSLEVESTLVLDGI